MRQLGTVATVFVGIIIGLVACSSNGDAHAQDGHAGHQAAPFAGVTKAVAAIRGTQGNEKVKGTVWFTQADKGIKVVADVEGLSPDGVHGFHIHEWGDTTSADGTSLGSHYNPEGHPHGGPGEPQSHAGDFGNLKADGDGKAHLELTLEGVSLVGENAILGRGLVVHAQPDDLKSQPTGNAGARIGVAVIGVAKP